MSNNHTRNHYVPVWFQKQFIDPMSRDKELHYLDLAPNTYLDGRGVTRLKRPLRRQGPKKCFVQDDLYTTVIGGKRCTDIEEVFFGKIDSYGKNAVECFSNLDSTLKGVHDHFNNLMIYMSAQKLRTPKGLGWLRQQVGATEKIYLLMQLMEYKAIFCAIWTECVWQIADASQSNTKFIISDHPVTIYNRECRPQSPECRKFNDPDIRMNASHTIFPISADKVLILTNLSWARNPYQNATRLRPNPDYFRNAIMSFLDIQMNRCLSEQEVREINFIIKRRALRYIAAGKEEWLYPEKYVSVADWNKYGHGYLCMPDPRSMIFSSGVMIGHKGGGGDAFDAYGRKPWQSGYSFNAAPNEMETFHNFQGEFARLYGPRRRGMSFEFGKIECQQDSESYHAYHLSLEKRRYRRSGK